MMKGYKKSGDDKERIQNSLHEAAFRTSIPVLKQLYAVTGNS